MRCLDVWDTLCFGFVIFSLAPAIDGDIRRIVEHNKRRAIADHMSGWSAKPII